MTRNELLIVTNNLLGKLRGAVRFFVNGKQEGVLQHNGLKLDKTGVMDETVTLVLERKHPHKKNPFYVGGVQKNAYFYSREHYGGCGQIVHAEKFGEFGQP